MFRVIEIASTSGNLVSSALTDSIIDIKSGGLYRKVNFEKERVSKRIETYIVLRNTVDC